MFRWAYTWLAGRGENQLMRSGIVSWETKRVNVGAAVGQPFIRARKVNIRLTVFIVRRVYFFLFMQLYFQWIGKPICLPNQQGAKYEGNQRKRTQDREQGHREKWERKQKNVNNRNRHEQKNKGTFPSFVCKLCKREPTLHVESISIT